MYTLSDMTAQTQRDRRISRGLYTRPDLDVQSHHSLVEAQMSVDSGIVCLLSALSLMLRARKANADELLRFADVCRVRNVMAPYLENIYQ